ncbi:MOSC domain-containing protein [Adonisia turfae]|uniref:MOSC domain-containing protein n=1 Tax=Adonisia turfae CCMR0081 TaxID=2292702 RepID=A0A6M0RYP2_9CYAN|nr:MOSC domain-containing protein [Adonisia turfae]NEZ60832.1 MOSC domain-containing protein [Adonisia turfae CCMR0081]
MSLVETPYLTSIQVGLVKKLGVKNASDPMDRPWSTGFFKEPVEASIWLGKTNLEGDRQADLRHHGGPEKAVLAYAAEHYPDWRQQLMNPALPYGAFGENFTVVGQTESSVCIGDTYGVGDAIVQVSQPRQPCWKLSRRWRIKDLALQVQRTGKTGWYFRVLQEGYVTPKQPLVLINRPYPQWTVMRANETMHHRTTSRDQVAELAELPLLAANWQRTLTNRASRGIRVDTKPRLIGENE